MALNYTEYSWGYADEFTPDLMNNIEHGIKAASDAVNEVNNNLKKGWILIETNINVYPNEINTLVQVTNRVPNEAQEILLGHSTLGDILITRPISGVLASYYIDEYHRISAWLEWSSQNIVSYKIIGIGSADFNNHYVSHVWYR